MNGETSSGHGVAFIGCVLREAEPWPGGGVKRPGFCARDSLSLAQNNRDGVCGNEVPVASGVGPRPGLRPSTLFPYSGKRAVRVGHTDRSVRAPVRSVLLIGRRAGCVYGDLHPLAAWGSAYRVDRVRSVDEAWAKLRPARRWCVVLVETVDHDPFLVPLVAVDADASDPAAHAWFVAPPHHVGHRGARVRVTIGVPDPDMRGRHRQRQGAMAAGNGLTHQRNPTVTHNCPPAAQLHYRPSTAVTEPAPGLAYRTIATCPHLRLSIVAFALVTLILTRSSTQLRG
jgi:hypothetical protein